MNSDIQKFLRSMPAEKQKLVMMIREIFLDPDTEITEGIKWGNLAFIYKGNLAFVYTFPKVDYINLGFIKAVELSDPKKLFEGTGKGMRHIKIFSEKDIPKTQLKKWIREAMALNEP